jgi:large subunit ribosomal protein L24
MAKRILNDDKVIVVTGKDKGKSGKVIKIDYHKNLVMVSGVNIIKRHKKKTDKSDGGIIESEGFINISNVAIICPKTDKKTKVGFKVLENGSKKRFSKSSGDTF